MHDVWGRRTQSDFAAQQMYKIMEQDMRALSQIMDNKINLDKEISASCAEMVGRQFELTQHVKDGCELLDRST